ncbi:TPA: DNA-binding protein [Enterococcus faecium]|nr:DNA-binding protein [Enterococcus faecium]HAQ4451880.1 DNA-binding protein [Enterococcus faecium]HAQ4700495.1 DNA-binding protein [Enterococcus faecium]
MAKLSIDELDLSVTLREVIRETAAKEGKQQAFQFIEEYKKKLLLPRFMNYKQAAKYMNTSYNTLKYNFIEKKGLRVILMDGYEKIDQRDADEFLEKHKK